jgi:hypothetical protein
VSVETFGIGRATFGPSSPAPLFSYGTPYIPPPCDHCLCLEPTEIEARIRTVPHKRCCHCQKLYAVACDEPSTDP